MVELKWDDIGNTPKHEADNLVKIEKVKKSVKIQLPYRTGDDDYKVPTKASLQKRSQAELADELHRIYVDLAEAMVAAGLIRSAKSAEKVVDINWWPQMQLQLKMIWNGRLL